MGANGHAHCVLKTLAPHIKGRECVPRRRGSDARVIAFFVRTHSPFSCDHHQLITYSGGEVQRPEVTGEWRVLLHNDMRTLVFTSSLHGSLRP